MELRVERSIEQVASDWSALADRAGAAPFLRPEWFACWWSAFGRGRLEILILRDDGRLTALLPLYRNRGALRSATNWHTPEYGVLAEDAGSCRALLDMAFARARGRVSVGFLNAGAPDSDALLEAARANGHRTVTRELERSPYVRTDGEWEAYRAGLDAHRLRETRRRRRRLEEQGTLTLTVEDGRSRLDELLEEGYRVESSGWKAEQGTAIASRADTRDFYTRLARWCARRGSLRLAFLRLDDRALAFQYLVEEGGVAYQLKGGYDPAYRKYAPGMLLAHDILARAFGEGLASYEFLGSEEAFKLEWTREARERIGVETFPRSAAGAVGWNAYVHGRPAAKRIRALVAR